MADVPVPLIEAPPHKSSIAVSAERLHPLTGKLPKFVIGRDWLQWLMGLQVNVEAKPTRHAKVKIAANSTGDVATTALPIGDVSAGVWRISVAIRVTRAGSVSSELQLTVTWTEGGVTQSESTANLATNTTTTREGKTFIIRPDADTPISYSIAYTDGGGATAMGYSADLVAEEVAQDTVS